MKTQLLQVLLTAALLVGVWGTAVAQTTEPGRWEGSVYDVSQYTGKTAAKTANLMAGTGLNPFYSTSGNITVSIDGLGMGASSGLIQVQKPAGATVRSAFLFSAAVWSNNLVNGQVSLQGNAINWDALVTSASGAPQGNGRKDVTSIVKPILDAAPPGVKDLTISENSGSIDGEILVVIFDDPSQTAPQTVVLAFGGQSTSGDDFAITLADPFDNATQDILMSLGISFGFQPAGQFSLVDVNGTRLTTSAGGYDDGEPANGALLTVGGIGDDPANPADPNLTDVNGSRYDDELYTLDPLLASGASNISVHTQNPSNDDNMFFAAFIVKGTAAIVGQGILLSPVSQTHNTGETATVDALVQDDNGNPIANRSVTFQIVSGPGAGSTSSGNTDATGHVQFSFTSSITGESIVMASFVDDQGNTITSNAVSAVWSTSQVCSASTFVETVDRPNRQVLLNISDPEGITNVDFVGLDDAPFLNNFTASSDVFTSSDGIHWSGSATNVQFTLTATADQASYFARITNACGTETTIDPNRNFANLSAHSFSVEGSHPNPFTTRTTLVFTVPQDTDVRVSVYDVTGREVRVLQAGSMGAGRHELTWDGRDGSGQLLSSGVYLYRVEAGSHVKTGRMLLVR